MLTQAEVAEAAGTHQSNIAKYEKAKDFVSEARYRELLAVIEKLPNRRGVRKTLKGGPPKGPYTGISLYAKFDDPRDADFVESIMTSEERGKVLASHARKARGKAPREEEARA